jgi:hypothetical protein
MHHSHHDQAADYRRQAQEIRSERPISDKLFGLFLEWFWWYIRRRRTIGYRQLE